MKNRELKDKEEDEILETEKDNMKAENKGRAQGRDPIVKEREKSAVRENGRPSL